jgi:reverse gyrase
MGLTCLMDMVEGDKFVQLMLIIPSGYGKTIVLAFFALVKWLRYEIQTVIVVPSELLAHQFCESMKFVNMFNGYDLCTHSDYKIWCTTKENLRSFNIAAEATGFYKKIKALSLHLDEADAAMTEKVCITRFKQAPRGMGLKITVYS